jgi:hypothetical protein
VRFQVLTAVNMKIAVFWIVVLVAFIIRRMNLIALMMEAENTSETLVNFYKAVRRNNPEDSHLQE